METSEILKKVRKIEIKARGLSANIFAGQYHSAFKGRGMAFSEVREYQYGDDVRDIDWNVTARFNKPYVKVFEEERELTVMLLIDVSGSLDFGTQKQLKRDVVPIYFEGHNSPFFYRLAYWRKRLGIKLNIEMLYLVDEMYGANGQHFTVHVLPPIPYTTFDGSRTPKEWAEYVKQIVYANNNSGC